MQETEVFFALLRAGMTGEAISTEVLEACTEEMLEKVYKIAYNHDVAQIIGKAFNKTEMPGVTAFEAFKQTAFMAFYRYSQIKYAYDGICKTLEEGRIPFIPLKGSVLRKYYPEPWMRTSCDIDILVRREDLENAKNLLVEKLQFKFLQKGNHDISLLGPNRVLLELHFRMIERWKKTENILQCIWNEAVPVRNGSFEYCLSNEMFCFFHIAHMAKHTAVGGCGLRPFLDLWIIDQHMPYDEKELKDLLQAGGWWQYYQAAENLYKAWFCNGKKDVQTQHFEEFILVKDAADLEKNQLIIDQHRKGGKKRYALLKIFLPYDHLKRFYPVLEKHRWLTPVYEAVRWCKLLFCGGIKRSTEELERNRAVTKNEYAAMNGLLEYLGINLDEEFIKD